MLFQHNKFSFTPSSSYSIKAVVVSLDSTIKNNPLHYNCTNQRSSFFILYNSSGCVPWQVALQIGIQELELIMYLYSHHIAFKFILVIASLFRKAKYNTPGYRIFLKQERQIFQNSSFNHICYSLIYIFFLD